MGNYINKGNEIFRSFFKREYIDKTGLIAEVNARLCTGSRFMCVTRSRRFGKSMAAQTLYAYYDHSCDSRQLFEDLEIAKDVSFEEHLNKYPTIYLDLTSFVTRYQEDDMVHVIDKTLKADVQKAYPDVELSEDYDLMDSLFAISTAKRQQFIFIIDEWDTICREFPSTSSVMTAYVNWLRRMFKDVSAMDVFAGVYMTGILPIKKYNTQSALNNFTEYSMIQPGRMARYFGFTQDEAHALSTKYNLDFDELEKWYDGYQIGNESSMFNPNSVMLAIDNEWCTSYWGKTASYEVVKSYIMMNFDGLKDDILLLLGGGRTTVDPVGFQNDMHDVRNRDDVLTLLIHLGYLSFDRKTNECFVPNLEVSIELGYAVRDVKWKAVTEALQNSDRLLKAILEGDAAAVAQGVEATHDENTSILSYNNENSLACVLSLALYTAKNDFIIHRELPTGKGFADLVLIPRKHVDKPAIVVELKVDRHPDTAIEQIHRKQYPTKLTDYTDRLLLVGISYDRQTKEHTCVIEQIRYGR